MQALNQKFVERFHAPGIDGQDNHVIEFIDDKARQVVAFGGHQAHAPFTARKQAGTAGLGSSQALQH